MADAPFQGRASSTDRGPVGRAARLDSLDRRIIEELQNNGRLSFREVARRLAVSEGTVRNRYGQLTEAKLLEVTVITNPLGVGFNAMAMIGVRISGPSSGPAEALAEAREVTYVVRTAGAYDLLVEVVCVDHDELLRVTDWIRGIDGVISTETCVYLDLVKQVVDWGFPAAPADNLPEALPDVASPA